MSLATKIRDKINKAQHAETREVGEWIIAELAAPGRKGGLASGERKARGGKSARARSKHMRELAALSHAARRASLGSNSGQSISATPARRP